MGRINPNEMDNYGPNNSSEWLKLSNDGDVARVQFLYHNYNELDAYACHKIRLDGKDRYVNCPRDYDSPVDDCPFCKAGLAIAPVMVLAMYDHKDKKIKIWQRGKTFRKKMEALFNRYPNLSNYVFDIERHGAAGDNKTTYDIYPMPDVEPLDVSNIEKPEFLGTVIMDKSADDMQYYLDHNEFPEQNDSQVSRRDEGISRRGGTPSRRVGR